MLLSLLSPSRLFIFLASVFGLILIFLTPPFQVPDEPNHFFRAFQIAEGHFVSEKHNGLVGSYVPKSLVRLMSIYDLQRIRDNKEVRLRFENVKDAWRQPLAINERTFEPIANTALYSPIPYLPQAVGIFIGKTFAFPPVALVYMGRICNLVIWIFMLWGAIRLTPIYRWLFVVLALVPMSLFEAASLSADALTYGLAFMAVACFFKLAFDQEQKVGVREMMLIITVTSLLTFCKNAYFLIFVLFLLIPASKFRDWKQRLAYWGILIFVNILALIVWSYLGDTSSNMQIYIQTCPIRNVNHVLQLRHIFSNIFAYIQVLVNTFVYFNFFYLGFVGTFGWLDVLFPSVLAKICMVMLFFYAIMDVNDKFAMRMPTRLVLSFYALGSAVIIATLLYMFWTPVDDFLIGGLQGRYFIPIAPAFFAMFYNNSRRVGCLRRWLPYVTAVYLIFMLSVTLGVIANRYYDHQFVQDIFGKAEIALRNVYLE